MAEDKPAESQDTATGTVDTSEWDKGFRGVEVDQTPNEAYSVGGVTSGTEAAEADNAAEEGRAPTADSAGEAGGGEATTSTTDEAGAGEASGSTDSGAADSGTGADTGEQGQS